MSPVPHLDRQTPYNETREWMEGRIRELKSAIENEPEPHYQGPGWNRSRRSAIALLESKLARFAPITQPAAGATKQAAGIKEHNMGTVDYSRPIRTKEGKEAILVDTMTDNASYRFGVKFKDDDGDWIFGSFDEDGDGLNDAVELENVPSGSEESDDAGAIFIPEHLRPRVRHSNRGSGRLVKVRNDDRKVFIQIDGASSGFWALKKNVSLIS